jgi:hypothetical protein
MSDFVALDGEGYDGRYALLASRHGTIENPDGLRTTDCLRFLVSLAERNRESFFIGYGIGYDVNMMLVDVPDSVLVPLLTEDVNETKFEEYTLRYYPRKIFEVRHRNVRFRWYDVLSFFGTSFVSALRRFIPGHPYLEAIAAGKADRSAFSREKLPQIRAYNEKEIEALENLMDVLRALFESQGIYLEKWHGPGAVASWLIDRKGYDIVADFPRYRPAEIPRDLRNAWRCAFFGGRIENVLTGTLEHVNSYDVNSAYPHSASLLPRHLPARAWKFRPTRRLLEHRLAVYHVVWSVSAEVAGPFPFRSRGGLITFPLSGGGWYHAPEVAAALRVFSRGISIDSVWYQEEDTPSKMSVILPSLYTTRQRLKREKNPAEYVLKLALNSVYGKFAQRKGKPQFRCPAWAGFITAHTRATLLEASRDHDVLAYATDSVFTRDVLEVPQSENLGHWKHDHYDRFTCIQNGFYKLDDALHSKQASRGVPRIGDWHAFMDELERTGKAIIRDQIFVTHKLAITYKRELGPYRLLFVDREKIIKPFATMKRVSTLTNLVDWTTDFSLSRPPRGSADLESLPMEE